MRSLLACLAFAACGGSDGTVHVDPLAWSWSFVDASGADVGCPANVPTVELVAYQAVSLVGECLEPPREVVARATFGCSQGRGALDPVPGTGGCDLDGTYIVRVMPKTSDNLIYAYDGDCVDVPPGGVAEGHTDIVAPRGFIRLAWTLVDSAANPKPCPGAAAVISTNLNKTGWPVDPRACSLLSAVLTGVPAGIHDFTTHLYVGKVSYGDGSVSGVSVAADAIVDAAVTIAF